MALTSVPASFMRGGTSKALMFLVKDLPAKRADWDHIFLNAMGSPDSYGRQLNGMGGGISSLSKVCVVSPSQRDDADVDYTFAQVLIDEARVDYNGNCGNMSSAVGPFAVDQGLVRAEGDEVTVRIFNTNTQKIIHAIFPVKNGKAVYEGDLEIPGVSGTGAAIRLNFVEPGGATTGKLLPTGNAQDILKIPGWKDLQVSMIDAANACVFVKAQDVGLKGTELPQEFESSKELLEKLDLIRRTASVAMGIASSLEEARKTVTVPYIALVHPAVDFKSLSGDVVPESEQDLCVRVIASGQPHRALPLTVSLCTAVAARLQGSVVFEISKKAQDMSQALRLGMPSGILTVGAEVDFYENHWHAKSGGFFRTARPLFEGRVWV